MILRRCLLSLCLLLSLPATAADELLHYVLPPTQVDSAVDAAKGRPLQYAVALPTRLDAADGSWDSPAPGIARWRLGLSSSGAVSLSLKLADLQLPAGSALRWIGEDSGDVQGPFGADSGTELLLPVVRGGRAILELQLPAAAKEQFGLRIASAYHGYRAFRTTAVAPEAKGQFGDSGSCNIDSSCAEGDDWRQQARSVVLLTLNGVDQCSGTLVNNTAQDGRALILTARHCRFDTGDDVRAYFNVSRPCNCSRISGRVDQNIAMLRVLAGNGSNGVDFALLELAALPPASFNPYYAGWDARAPAVASPQSGAGIHHPRGDDRKISLYRNPPPAVENADAGGGLVIDGWEVLWSRGTTENGSSGSALFNQDRRIVGTLSGGAASCANPQASDIYARLDRAWTAGSAGNAQLKAHLAPGSNLLVMDGLEGGIEPAPLSCPAGGGGALAWPPLLGLLSLAWLRRCRAGGRKSLVQSAPATRRPARRPNQVASASDMPEL